MFGNAFDRRKLEQILHPLVASEREKFLLDQRNARAPLVVLDIPLLFEIGTHKLCDLIVVTNVTSDIQRKRAMSREGMTDKKLTGILKSQMSLSDKVSQADFILNTRNSRDTVRRQLFAWLDQILC